MNYEEERTFNKGVAVSKSSSRRSSSVIADNNGKPLILFQGPHDHSIYKISGVLVVTTRHWQQLPSSSRHTRTSSTSSFKYYVDLSYAATSLIQNPQRRQKLIRLIYCCSTSSFTNRTKSLRNPFLSVKRSDKRRVCSAGGGLECTSAYRGGRFSLQN